MVSKKHGRVPMDVTIRRFAEGFASALIKLRKGSDDGVAVILNPKEVHAVVQALKLMRHDAH